MSNLILIYGPPAAGKLTVGQELAKRLGYKIFLNHQLVGSVASVFSFDDQTLKPIRNKLARKFRIEIFEEALINGLNVITTYGGSSKNKFDFFNDVEKITKKHNGKCFFVHLTPVREALLERVESSSRKGHKIDTKDFLTKKLKQNDYYQSYKTENHIKIDNTSLAPEEVADLIIKHFYL